MWKIASLPVCLFTGGRGGGGGEGGRRGTSAYWSLVAGTMSFPWSWPGGRGRGVPQSGPRTGVPPPPWPGPGQGTHQVLPGQNQNMGTSSPHLARTLPPPPSQHQDRGTPSPYTPLPPPQQDMQWIGYSAGGVPSAFSRRRTFLCIYASKYIFHRLTDIFLVINK